MVVGVAFQNLPSADSIGYIIPIVSGGREACERTWVEQRAPPLHSSSPPSRTMHSYHSQAVVDRFCLKSQLAASTATTAASAFQTPTVTHPRHTQYTQPVVDRFLSEVQRHGEYRGYCSLGIVFQTLENAFLRASLGMGEGLSGVLVNRVQVRRVLRARVWRRLRARVCGAV